MTRQARRSKTKWIKLMKKRGFAWRSGRLWRKYRWVAKVPLGKEWPP